MQFKLVPQCNLNSCFAYIRQRQLIAYIKLIFFIKTLFVVNIY